MLPGFKSLASIAIYTPDLTRALATYRALGLRPDGGEGSGPHAAAPGRSLRFADDGATLVLHDDPQRQFVEVIVEVEDVAALYRRLALDPDYTWLETPQPDAAGWRAVVRLPDDNVYTVRSRDRVALASGPDGARERR